MQSGAECTPAALGLRPGVLGDHRKRRCDGSQRLVALHFLAGYRMSTQQLLVMQRVSRCLRTPHLDTTAIGTGRSLQPPWPAKVDTLLPNLSCALPEKCVADCTFCLQHTCATRTGPSPPECRICLAALAMERRNGPRVKCTSILCLACENPDENDADRTPHRGVLPILPDCF